MKTKAIALASAFGLVLGVSAVGARAAVLDVVSWDLTDFNNDGLRSDFLFFSAPTGNSTNLIGFTPETGCINAPDGDTCVPIDMNGSAIAPQVFSAGFLLGGAVNFRPNFTDGGADATLDSGIAGGLALNFSALNFGADFGASSTEPGYQLFFAPDNLTNCTGTAGCGTFGNGYNVETLSDLGGGNYGVVVRYVSTINDPTSSFDNFQANWRLEGVMSTVPVPAAAWLFASGLLGLGAWTRRRR